MFVYGLVLILAAASAQEISTVNGKVKITTVTTAGCGDTVNFITRQLNPVYEEFKDHLILDFVPWGRTQRLADGNLRCQFGTRDCWANRVHRCTLELLKNNQDAQMSYMNCEFDGPRPAYLLGSYTCAAAAGVSLVDLDVCVATEAGDRLDAANEAASAEPMRVINFVPAIVFNDNIDLPNHNLARRSLRSMVCFALAGDASTGVTNCGL
ncbi:hypothetical protein JYU34_017621 [Plutella xylostella]|uniref:Uncharacterized protein n=1 Tax=Plutella xylostella TaxID=51655 RepID=A0ABQ7Q1L0_PLUXY|nr:hypothetical protein JYU34_017621 [Plutella xylostella]